MRGEDYGGLVSGGFYWEDVPGVRGDYVGGEEVDFFWVVGDVAGADGADVGMLALADGALYLNAAEEAAVVGGDVVGGGVSPRLGYAESSFYGAGDET